MVKFGGHDRAIKPGSNEDEGWVSYVCYSCGVAVNGAVVARPTIHAAPEWKNSNTRWLWCSHCGAPAVRDDKGVIRPGARFGPSVQGMPAEVTAAYDEARDCMSVGAYTGAELLCRKILMYVAVRKGLSAKDSKGRAPGFEKCVDYLVKEGYVTPPMKRWVGRIRDHGNDATHELEPPSKERAESTVTFTAQMLNNIYGMEFLAAKHAPPKTKKAADTTANDSQ